MSKILTVAEVVADIDELITKVCAEEGLDKDEFLLAVCKALPETFELVAV
jgi:hypothetical protein